MEKLPIASNLHAAENNAVVNAKRAPDMDHIGMPIGVKMDVLLVSTLEQCYQNNSKRESFK